MSVGVGMAGVDVAGAGVGRAAVVGVDSGTGVESAALAGGDEDETSSQKEFFHGVSVQDKA